MPTQELVVDKYISSVVPQGQMSDMLTSIDPTSRSAPSTAFKPEPVSPPVSPAIKSARPYRPRSPASRLRKRLEGHDRERESLVENQGCFMTEFDQPDDEPDSEEKAFDTDLEDEIAPDLSIHNGTAQEIYLKTCKSYNVVPVSYFLRNMNNNALHMKNHGLGPKGIKAICVPLQINTAITRLDLEGNSMEEEGARHLSFMLNENIMIVDLNLSYNKIRSHGASVLCRSLLHNGNIKRLNVAGNGFEDKDAHAFKQLLETNTKIKALNLSNNNFHEAGATFIGKALAQNNSLETLDLSWNHIRLSGADGFVKGLMENQSLRYLYLAMNGFSNNGAIRIGEFLQTNSKLKELDLTNNRIGPEGCAAIAKAMAANQRLKVLRMGLNLLSIAGALGLLEAITENQGTQVEMLDLRGTTVNPKFIRLACDFNEDVGGFNIRVGFVSTCKDIMGEEDQYRDMNPLEILLIFMNERNLRLVDLFKSLDKDQSMSLTRAEFIEGLKTVNSPLNQAQLDALIDMLDKDGDGEIDLLEILNINKEFKSIRMKANIKAKQKKDAAKQKLKTAVNVVKAVNRLRNETGESSSSGTDEESAPWAANRSDAAWSADVGTNT